MVSVEDTPLKRPGQNADTILSMAVFTAPENTLEEFLSCDSWLIILLTLRAIKFSEVDFCHSK